MRFARNMKIYVILSRILTINTLNVKSEQIVRFFGNLYNVIFGFTLGG